MDNMKNLLIMGIDTRPMVNSALNLDYKTFSVSYFKTVDFKMPFREKHVLNQESVISCGRFEENYSPMKLLQLFDEMTHENENAISDMDEMAHENENAISDIDEGEIDKIVLTTGINANDFCGKFEKYKKIIYGNKKTEKVDNKFKFINSIKNKFDVPLTFQPTDVDELNEILQQHDNNQFILKPLQGSGGLGIFLLNNESLSENNNGNEILEKISYENYILQEYIDGINVSSSVLSSHNEHKNLINSRLITEHDLGNDTFEYSGNILPLDKNSLKMFNGIQTNFDADELNEEMKNISEDLMKEFKLVGSNGVDYVLEKSGQLKVIEINPRFQGTYELVENVLGINLLEAHIKACEGELIEIPNAGPYSVKKIIYARKQVNIGNLNIPNVFDVPYQGVKIEKDQPLVTIISCDNDLEKAMADVKIAEKKVFENID